MLALLLATTACAPLQSERLLKTADAFPKPVELDGVVFFAQDDYQCGPAALAEMLDWAGVPITPAELVPQVYVPDREGSFQLELLAAARRHERIPYVLQPQLESLLTEVASGHPVLVLQNLGLGFAPTWHYAVVVGFDLPNEQIVLRSGRERRHVVPLRTFEHTWARSQYWAMVVAPADDLPYTAEELPYIQSVATLERLGFNDTASKAYASALKRWPRSLTTLMGLGNTRHALGDLSGAEDAFRRATQYHPQSAAAYNNLAQTLADQARYDHAEQTARRAIELAGSEPIRATAQQTLDDISKRRTTPATDGRQITPTY